MYSLIRGADIPIKEHGNASRINSFSILTASRINLIAFVFGNRCLHLEYSRQAKSVWSPSSRAINSLEAVRPGIRPLCLSQKIAQNAPLKKTPSMAANAMRRVGKSASSLPIHDRAHSAFFCIHGTV